MSVLRKVDELIEMLRGYRHAKIWLKNYREQMMLLEDKLVGKIGGSVIVVSEGESNESYRRSSVNDEINAYVLDNKNTYQKCEELVEFCEEIVERIRPEYRLMIEDIYFYGMSYASASAKYDVGRTYLYEVVRRELHRVMNYEESR